MITTRTRISGDYIKSNEDTCYDRRTYGNYGSRGRTFVSDPFCAPVCPVITPPPVFVSPPVRHYTYSSGCDLLIGGAALLTLLAVGIISGIGSVLPPICHQEEVCYGSVFWDPQRCHLEEVCRYS